jgi:hypothetical protein
MCVAKDLLQHHKRTVKNAGVSYFEKTRPYKGTMYFGTWIDAEGEFFDTAHFADSLQNILSGRRLLFVIGKCRVVTTTLLPSKWQKCRSYLTRVILIQTDNTKRINKLKKM